MRRIIISLTALLILSGCVSYDINEILLQRDEISLTSKGEVQMTYDPQTCQLSYNESDNEFRLYKDNLSDWFIMTCESKPVEQGQIVKASVSWTTETNAFSIDDLEFEVMRLNEKGRIWMWCQASKLGVVIQTIQ